jgi:hypothetical protein
VGDRDRAVLYTAPARSGSDAGQNFGKRSATPSGDRKECAMEPLMPMIWILPLLAFWLWMFWDMTTNDNLPNSSMFSQSLNYFHWTKLDWTLAFIVLNVFAALLYYFTQYRKRH